MRVRNYRRRLIEKVVRGDVTCSLLCDPLQHVPIRSALAGLVSPKRLARDADPLRKCRIGDGVLTEVGRQLHGGQSVTKSVTLQEAVTILDARSVTALATCSLA